MSEYHDTDTGEVFEPVGTYRRSSEIAELFAALAKAQGQFEMAERAGENEGFKRGGKPSTYATLASVLEATKEGRSSNGLALIQLPSNGVGHNISVTTLLGHSSGQWLESTFSMAPLKFDAQGAGSVVTYLRRYAALSMLGIAPEDDDGNAAVGQPDGPITKGATRTAKPSTGNDQVPPGISKFLAGNSYEIDPDNVGGLSPWQRFYLRVAAYCDLYQLTKLEVDNTAHRLAFAKAVRPEVDKDFTARLARLQVNMALAQGGGSRPTKGVNDADGPLMEEGDVGGTALQA